MEISNILILSQYLNISISILSNSIYTIFKIPNNQCNVEKSAYVVKITILIILISISIIVSIAVPLFAKSKQNINCYDMNCFRENGIYIVNIIAAVLFWVRYSLFWVIIFRSLLEIWYKMLEWKSSFIFKNYLENNFKC